MATVPSPATAPVQAFALGEEEISDVTLASFHLFDKETIDQSRSLLHLTRCGCGCGCGGGGCRVEAVVFPGGGLACMRKAPSHQTFYIEETRPFGKSLNAETPLPAVALPQAERLGRRRKPSQSSPLLKKCTTCPRTLSVALNSMAAVPRLRTEQSAKRISSAVRARKVILILQHKEDEKAEARATHAIWNIYFSAALKRQPRAFQDAWKLRFRCYIKKKKKKKKKREKSNVRLSLR